MRQVLEASLKRIEWGSEIAARRYPWVRAHLQGKQPKSIVVDPRRDFGQPIIAGRGIQARLVTGDTTPGSRLLSSRRTTSSILSRSRTRSGARRVKPPEPYTWFIDRSLGRKIATGLRDAQFQVEEHGSHFADDAPDLEWLSIAYSLKSAAASTRPQPGRRTRKAKS